MKKQIAAAVAAMFVMSTAAAVLAAPIELTGNVRYKLENIDDDGIMDPEDKVTNKLRYRLGASATVNDNWKIVTLFEGTENMRTSNEGNDVKLAVNRVYLDGKMGDAGMKLGRFAFMPGHGMVVDSYLDGVSTSFGAGPLNTTLYYGKMNTPDADTAPKLTYTGAELGYAVTDNTDLKLAYHKVEDDTDDATATEFGFDSKMTEDITLVGTYATSDADAEDTAWEFGVKYKGADKKEVGSFGTWAFYRNLEANAMYKPTYDYANVTVNDGTEEYGVGFKGFEIGFNYTVDKNMVWTTAYATGDATTEGVDTDGKYFKTQLEVFF